MSKWLRYPGGHSTAKTDFGRSRDPLLKFTGREPAHRLILNRAAAEALRCERLGLAIPSSVLLDFDQNAREIKISPTESDPHQVSLIPQTAYQYLISAQGFKNWAGIRHWPRNECVKGSLQNEALVFSLPQEPEIASPG